MAHTKTNGPSFGITSSAFLELHTLTALRDTFLSKLMSGELRVVGTAEEVSA
jgi:hypothetical protein